MSNQIVHKAFKYRLYPNESQKELLSKHFGCSRFVFNYFLNQRQSEYRENKTSLSYYDNASVLTSLKKEEDYKWLKEVNAQSMQQTLKQLDTAYSRFFKKISAFPKYKSKRSKQSFKVPAAIKVINDRLIIPKFKGGIKINLHRELKGKIKSCVVSKTTTDKYYVSILVEVQHELVTSTGKQVGIDLGLKDLVITSEGKKYKNNRYTKKYQRQLKKAQQHLSRKVRGSNRYEKQRRKVALIHEKITNSRLDNLHKVTTDLVRKYDLISVESLNVKGMVKNHKLSKHISDASWGELVRQLEYKCSWNEKTLVKVDRFFPSSKTCSSCGWIKSDLKLSDRIFECTSCGEVHDRDINASLNILKEGLNNINR